jgi:NADP-reducing hydrogenase subunit HndB
MPKLKLEDLDRITKEVRQTTVLREGAGRARVTMHMGTCGIAAGARQVMSALLEEMEKLDLPDVLITTSGCAGLCSREPMATVEILDEPPIKYGDLNGDKIKDILKKHVQGGQIVTEYAIALGSETTH